MMNLGKRGQSNKGTTLVELVVTFALLSLFMVAATKAMASMINSYYEAKGITCGMRVSSFIMSKISGEIEGSITEGVVGPDSEAVYISDDGAKIEFCDYSGSHVNISAVDGYMDIYYYATEDADGNSVLDENHWTYDKKAYLGYEIKNLSFSIPKGDYPGNIIKVDLTLHSSRYGDYSITRYVQCYNFETEALYSKIASE